MTNVLEWQKKQEANDRSSSEQQGQSKPSSGFNKPVHQFNGGNNENHFTGNYRNNGNNLLMMVSKPFNKIHLGQKCATEFSNASNGYHRSIKIESLPGCGTTIEKIKLVNKLCPSGKIAKHGLKNRRKAIPLCAIESGIKTDLGLTGYMDRTGVESEIKREINSCNGPPGVDHDGTDGRHNLDKKKCNQERCDGDKK